MGLLMQIESILKSSGQRVLKQNNMSDNFPITMNDYPSMDAQLKTG